MRARQLFLNVAVGILLLVLGWQLGVIHERGTRRVTIGAPSGNGLIAPGQSASGVTVNDPEHDADISVLWDVWNQLNEHYIEPQKLQVTPLIYGAARGLVEGVGDPYTVFMSPKESEDFRQGLAGDLEGIGAELTFRDGLVIVVSPLKDSPAERAGLHPKDVLIQVDGESVEGWSLTQVVSHIRGPQGSTVNIRVARENAGTLDFTITREQIHVPSVEAKTLTANKKTYGYAALNQFGEQSIAELRKQMQKFKDQKVEGIVLDLRNNGGGYLDGAVDLLSMFLREGKVVTVEHREVGSGDVRSVDGKPLLPDMPIVVLQNEATASASEIVAGALQDYGRATIVGQKSFGKGTVQEVVELSDGSSLRVTVAHWLTPKGKNLGKEGVHPDIVSELPKGFVSADFGDLTKDVQLQAALDVLTGKK